MKKILSVSFAILFIIISSTQAFADKTFLSRSDIPILKEDSTEVALLIALDVLKGTGNGYELKRDITRAESVCLIFRMHPENPGVIGMPSPVFSDLDGHWAYKEVTAAKKMGLVNGTSETTFHPDRVITGKEFTKILLTMLGYNDVTIENVYQLGIESGVLSDDFTKSVVYNNEKLLRGDAVRLCYSALIS